MQKVVIFIPTLTIGGIERVLLTYAVGLNRRDYDVKCLVPVKKENEVNISSANIHIDYLRNSRLRYSFFEIVLYFLKNKPNVIITANDTTLIVFLANLLSFCPAKIITSHHNYFDGNLDVKWRHKFIAKYIYPFCNKIIVVSNGIFEILNSQFAIKRSKMITIPNPIDVGSVMGYADETVMDIPEHDYVLFVGRFSAVKNLTLLLSAYKIFIEKVCDIKLVMIGDGEEAEKMHILVKEMGLYDSVILMGMKSNPYPYIKRAKLVMLSSFSEAFPVILIESLVLGRTIVSTPTYGAIDILKNGKFGYLSKSLLSVTDFAEKMIIAYENQLDETFLFKEAVSSYGLEEKITVLEKILE